MAGVFLSYRRSDSGGWAGRFRDHLALRYGKDRVWQTSTTLPSAPITCRKSSRTSPRPTPFSSSSARTGSMSSRRAASPPRQSKGRPAHRNRSRAQTEVRCHPDARWRRDNARPRRLPRPVAPLVKRNGIAIVDEDWSRSMQLLFEKLQDLP